jgi:DNA invertase Pin-like site-specific DNA recombinase
MKNYVAYYRVSTQQQGYTRLGLDAQKSAVLDYARHSGGRILFEYTEIESGRKDNRQELHKAIAIAKANGAVLLIAKLDRLARNAGFIFTLRDAGVSFVCCDMPDANTLTIGIFAALAQYEAELISSRTKAALAQKKAQGFKLGTPKPYDQAARDKSIAVRKAKTERIRALLQDSAALIKETIQLAEYKKETLTLPDIVRKLNTYKLYTMTGKQWTAENIRPLFATIMAEMNLKQLPKYSEPTKPKPKSRKEHKPHKPENKFVVAGIIIQLRTQKQSFRKIATHLNELGYKTSQDKDFTSVQVRRVLLEYSTSTT